MGGTSLVTEKPEIYPSVTGPLPEWENGLEWLFFFLGELMAVGCTRRARGGGGG